MKTTFKDMRHKGQTQIIAFFNAAINIYIKIIKKKTTVKMTLAATLFPLLSIVAKNLRKRTPIYFQF